MLFLSNEASRNILISVLPDDEPDRLEVHGWFVVGCCSMLLFVVVVQTVARCCSLVTRPVGIS